MPERLQKGWRLPLLFSIGAIHLAIIAAFLVQRGTVDLAQVREQSRLTLISIAKVMQTPSPETPEPEKDANQPHEETLAEVAPALEWSRVPNWRPRTSGTSAGSGGGGSGYDATRLLAGLGAGGPAGPSDGVADPYAGASIVWGDGGKKSSLLLIGAPNPAALEQVVGLVTQRFPGLRGYARLTVVIDKDGVVTKVARIVSDLPMPAQQLLETNIAGRILSAPRQAEQTLDLPEIVLS